MKKMMKCLAGLLLGAVLVMVVLGCENGSSDGGGGNTELTAQDLIGTWVSEETDLLGGNPVDHPDGPVIFGRGYYVEKYSTEGNWESWVNVESVTQEGIDEFNSVVGDKQGLRTEVCTVTISNLAAMVRIDDLEENSYTKFTLIFAPNKKTFTFEDKDVLYTKQ